LHEDYDNSVIGPHDIALIKVDEPFVLNAYVQIIGLPVADSIPIGDADISGWGSVSTDLTSIMPDRLQVSAINFNIMFLTILFIDLNIHRQQFYLF